MIESFRLNPPMKKKCFVISINPSDFMEQVLNLKKLKDSIAKGATFMGLTYKVYLKWMIFITRFAIIAINLTEGKA